MKKLNLVYVFHANQCINGVIPWADEVCYKKLLAVFRKHPSVKIVLHISGTLLHGLNYFAKERLTTIAEGVREGQFELLGSAYSQNVLYSCSEYDNQQQIQLHKEVLAQYFSTVPHGFWNPERCWTQSYVDLIADSGYEYTLIEEQFLRNAGVDHELYHVRKTAGRDNRKLTLFTDNLVHQTKCNAALNTGDFDPLFEYYRSIFDQETDLDSTVICYAEDAEATGMWQQQNNQSGESVLNNLDKLMCRLEKEEWINVTTFSEYMETHEVTCEIGTIPDGQATWMVESAQREGYRDWFDYNARYEGIVYYRKLFTRISRTLANAEELAERAGLAGALQLVKLAHYLYAVYQYEFGCAFGSAGTEETVYLMCNRGASNWESVRDTLFIIEAVNNALRGIDVEYEADIDEDGIKEFVVVKEGIMYVLSPVGGKILYAFDLEEGVDLIGNPLYEEWQRPWEHSSAFTYEYSGKERGITGDVRYKRRCFEDLIQVNQRYIGRETKYERLDRDGGWRLRNVFGNTKLESRRKKQTITYTCLHEGLTIEKIYDFSEKDPSVTYRFREERGRKRKITIAACVAASCNTLAMLAQGMDSVTGSVHAGKVNVHSQNGGAFGIELVQDAATTAEVVNKSLILGTCFEYRLAFTLEKKQVHSCTFFFTGTPGQNWSL